MCECRKMTNIRYANNVDVLIYILAGFLLIGFSIIFPIQAVSICWSCSVFNIHGNVESSFELVGWLFVNLCKMVQHVESNAKGQLKVGDFFL